MELEKKKITRWKIKEENLAPLEITTIEQEGFLPQFQIKQGDFNLSYSDFQQYMDYLNYIKTLFDPNHEPPQNQIPEVNNQPRISDDEVIPIKFPENINIPEIFIYSPSGLCLFHFEFYGTPNSNPLDQHLVSGLFSAINLFADKMGWKKGLNLIRAENVEVRFHMGNKILIALLSNTEMKINYLIEPILEDLAVELASQFEKEFKEVLAVNFAQGIVNPDQFSAFSNSIDRIFIHFRRQTFELYQKLILNEAIYFEVPADICTHLIHQLSEGRSVVNELGELMKKYNKIRLAIKKINYEQRALWNLFKTPIYEV